MTHYEDLQKQEPTRPKITLARALEIAKERFGVKPEEALHANFLSQTHIDSARREQELLPPEKRDPVRKRHKEGPHWSIHFSVREFGADDALWSTADVIAIFEDGDAWRAEDLYPREEE